LTCSTSRIPCAIPFCRRTRKADPTIGEWICGDHWRLVPRADRAIHARLRKAVEKRERAYLWTPADAITYKPYVSPTIYGDGRALFAITTINQRPAYWVIRGCSTWGCASDRKDSIGPDFGEITDVVLTDLEDAFGRGRCGYSGNSLFWPKKDRIKNCQCEECRDGRFRMRWPAVDYDGGCSWSRMDWPKGFATVKNSLSWEGNLLATERAGGI
jgi:hypothetical protein